MAIDNLSTKEILTIESTKLIILNIVDNAISSLGGYDAFDDIDIADCHPMDDSFILKIDFHISNKISNNTIVNCVRDNLAEFSVNFNNIQP